MPLVRCVENCGRSRSGKEERLARLKANEAALTRIEEMERRVRPAESVERLALGTPDRIRQLSKDASHEESVRRLFSRDF